MAPRQFRSASRLREPCSRLALHSVPELSNADVRGHTHKSGGSEMRVERKRVADALGPHEREAGGVHEAEVMVTVSVEDRESAPLQIVTDEDALKAPRLIERLQESPAGIVAACHTQQRVGLANDVVRRDKQNRQRDQPPEGAGGLLVMCIVDDLSRKPRAAVDKDSPRHHRGRFRARSESARTRSWRSEASGRRLR